MKRLERILPILLLAAFAAQARTEAEGPRTTIIGYVRDAVASIVFTKS